jgi:hypothetical protein
MQHRMTADLLEVHDIVPRKEGKIKKPHSPGKTTVGRKGIRWPLSHP